MHDRFRCVRMSFFSCAKLSARLAEKNVFEMTHFVFIYKLNQSIDVLSMKLFKTVSIDIVKDCLSCFAIDLPSCVCKKKARYVHIAL